VLVIGEAIDRDFGVRSDAERRSVEEQELDLAGAARGDPLVGEIVDADPKHAGVEPGRLAAGIGIDRRGDADPRRRPGRGRRQQRAQQPGGQHRSRTARPGIRAECVEIT